MNMMNLKIAELRKKRGLTQQELGNMLSVSFQTISKWEHGVTLPDITILPDLSRCFLVSVDELLGLVPLKSDYRPSGAGQKEYWSDRSDYLTRTRKTLWNPDYMRFLIQEIWQIDKPVKMLDCGCGYGAMGLLMLPFLPEGSSYTGLDFSEELLAQGRERFAAKEWKADFRMCDLTETRPKGTYDLVVSQSLLRHADHGKQLIQTMADAAGKGGLVVSVECNREFEEAGLYIDGMDYSYLCSHGGLKTLWETEYTRQKRDYSIAMKLPHYMREAGLRHVDARLSDRITYLSPDHEDYRSVLADIIAANGWAHVRIGGDAEQAIQQLMSRGMDRTEAGDYVKKQNEITVYLKEHKEEVKLTMITGNVISYGWKQD